MSDAQTVLWPKEGRRQPIMVGRDSAGRPLPGGPYTIYQLGAVLIVGVLGWITRGLWGASLGIISQLIFIAGAVALAMLGAGHIDFMKTNPVWAVTGWAKQVTASIVHPASSSSRREKPQMVLGRTVQLLPDLDIETLHPQPLGADEQTPVPAPQTSDDQPDDAAATIATSPSERPVQRRFLPRRFLPAQPTADEIEPQFADKDLAVEPIAPQPPAPMRTSALAAFLAAADRSHP